LSNYLITGAATPGIGEAVTRALAATGASIHCAVDKGDLPAAGLLQAELGEAVSNVKAVDFADLKSLRALVDSLDQTFDGVVIAHSYFGMEDQEQFDYVDWNRSLAINLTAPNFILREIKPLLRNGASLITVTSTEAFSGSFGASSYAATKAAMHNLTKTLANLYGGQGVRVNCVAPGWIGGVMDTDTVFEMSRQITPLARLGTPNEVAAAVLFLLTDASSFINGTSLVVDGGYLGVDSISKFEFDAASDS
jgi:NAD(P)-dependent dehydrogenase (short-subunit alcohol dehydrogenase family)